MGRLRGGGVDLPPPILLPARLLHRHVRPGHIQPQPGHRVPLAAGRPRDRGAYPSHEGQRGVQALRQEAPGVQVLVPIHPELRHRVLHDVRPNLRRARLLAHTSHVLVHAVLHDDEAADQAHDQAPVRAVLVREEAVRQGERRRRRRQRRRGECGPQGRQVIDFQRRIDRTRGADARRASETTTRAAAETRVRDEAGSLVV
mmetsp:Transcript_11560/g.44975  ORF Transcript_11560/g.44975 Transcript_11560/m.44975 type:complete len:201 (-) Transcript_11560:53-655(-)